jgi:hypothetical protein
LQERIEAVRLKLDKATEARIFFRDFKEKHSSTSHPNTLREFQELGLAAGVHRKERSVNGALIPQIGLEPNHSHFIFADDGSLNFGTDAKLRADVETCVAGVFKGVGVKQPGAGGKILQRIDDGITRMLVHKLKKGWEDCDLPLVPEKNAEANFKREFTTHRCETVNCGRFLWGLPEVEFGSAGSVAQKQRKCEFCLRSEAIKQKLRDCSPPAGCQSILSVDVIALRHALMHKEPIKWNATEIDRQKQHHAWYVELLQLHQSGCKCFVVCHGKDELGYFNGSMPGLLDLVQAVQQDIVSKIHKPPPTKSRERRANRAIGRKRSLPQEVPMVCVCVEGGPGTINTVVSAAKNSTACLLVKGSGRAACLLSDAVLLKDLKTSPKVLDSQQEAFTAFLVKDLGMRMDKTQGSFDYHLLLSRLDRSEKLMQTWKKKQEETQRKPVDWDDFRGQCCREWSRYKTDNPLLSEALRIEWLASLLVQKYFAKTPFCVTRILHSVFEAADTGKCKVH